MTNLETIRLTDGTTFTAGDNVRHEVFGMGTIERCVEIYNNKLGVSAPYVVVKFSDSEKTVHPAFVELVA